ncbi:MAG: GNAT family N-acetyltransferase [Cellulosilyticum sp.]|nr:GNAT family N-acetyltransferase [Cellulosilyticum sp.]
MIGYRIEHIKIKGGLGCSEHLVVLKLRQEKALLSALEYVAIEDEKMVGHIAYSRMFYGIEHTLSNEVIAFGPISVHPDYQRRGIGKKLIEETLNWHLMWRKKN